MTDKDLYVLTENLRDSYSVWAFYREWEKRYEEQCRQRRKEIEEKKLILDDLYK